MSHTVYRHSNAPKPACKPTCHPHMCSAVRRQPAGRGLRSRLQAAELGADRTGSRTAREKVLELLGQGFDNYMPGNDLAAAVDDLLRHNPTPSPGVATMQIGHGTWELAGPPFSTLQHQQHQQQQQHALHVLPVYCACNGLFHEEALHHK
eukprot:jgi/Chrzof1/3115/Cz12g12160.t1